MRFGGRPVDLILRYGSRTEMVNAFRLADNLGGGIRNDTTCMLRYVLAGFRGLHRLLF
jgi:hypothetical protein